MPSVGIGPSNLFCDRSNISSETKPLKLLGLLHQKLLLSMSSSMITFRWPMLYGISPLNLFESNNKVCNEWSFPMDLGIAPVKLLFENERTLRFFKLVIVLGMLPLSILFSRNKDVNWLKLEMAREMLLVRILFLRSKVVNLLKFAAIIKRMLPLSLL